MNEKRNIQDLKPFVDHLFAVIGEVKDCECNNSQDLSDNERQDLILKYLLDFLFDNKIRDFSFTYSINENNEKLRILHLLDIHLVIWYSKINNKWNAVLGEDFFCEDNYITK